LRRVVDDRRHVLSQCRSAVQVWGQDLPEPPLGGFQSATQREALVREAREESTAYGQLRRVMDLWATLWAWPLSERRTLPTRHAWWAAVEEALGLEPAPLPAGQLELAPISSRPTKSAAPAPAKQRDLWDVVRQTAARLRPLRLGAGGARGVPAKRAGSIW
jgi:hypothetical protein